MVVIYALMENSRGILLARVHEQPRNYEERPRGRFVVFAVPQIPDLMKLDTDPDTVKPTCELLLPLWVPEGSDLDTLFELPGITPSATFRAKANWLALKFRPHIVPEPASAADYVPFDHRAHQFNSADQTWRALDLGGDREYVTVAYRPDSETYMTLNDKEFEAERADAVDGLYVVGQTIRPANPSHMPRRSNSLLGLFGLENPVDVHMPALAEDQSVEAA